MNKIILISSTTILLALALITFFPSVTTIIYRILSLAGIITSSYTLIKFACSRKYRSSLFCLLVLGLYLNLSIVISKSPLSMLNFEH